MTDRAQRSLRTLIQSVLAIIAGGGLVTLWNAVAENYQVNPVVAVAVTVIIGPAIVSWAQNELEDAGKIKTVLKEPATPAAVIRTKG